MLKYKNKETGKWVYVPTNLSAEALDLIKEIEKDVGDISQLNTDDKSDVVSAIAEALDLIKKTEKDVGDISQLNTDDKSDVVSAINEISSKKNKKRDLIVLAAYNSSPEDKEVANVVLSRDDDASKVIKEAMDKMEEVQGTVLLKDGDYRVRSALIVNNNDVMLKGESRKASIVPIVDIQADWSNPFNRDRAVLYLGGSSTVQSLTISGDTSIDGYIATIEGAGVLKDCDLYHSSQHGVAVKGAARIDSCTVNNTKFLGFYAQGYSKLSNCKALHCSGGFSLMGFAEGSYLHAEGFDTSGISVTQDAVASHCTVTMPRNLITRHEGIRIGNNAVLSYSSVIGFGSASGVGISQNIGFKGLCAFNIVQGSTISLSPEGVTEYNVVNE